MAGVITCQTTGISITLFAKLILLKVRSKKKGTLLSTFTTVCKHAKHLEQGLGWPS